MQRSKVSRQTQLHKKRERERSVERYTQLRGGTLPVMPVIEVCSRHTQPRPGKPWILFHAGLLNIIHM